MSDTVPAIPTPGCSHHAHFTDKDEEAWRKDRTYSSPLTGRGTARIEARPLCLQTFGSDESKAEAVQPGADVPHLKGTPGSRTLIIKSMSQLVAHNNTNATEV